MATRAAGKACIANGTYLIYLIENGTYLIENGTYLIENGTYLIESGIY